MEKPEKSRYERILRDMAVAILVVGLAAAGVVFIMASPPVGDDEAGTYVASVDNSKKYRLELERIGGTSAVVAAEFGAWFDGLWHGRRLAGTLAVLSVGAALLCLLAAKIPPLDD
ncbi:MAG: hypothetical protein PHY45_10215 [Rhodocyclaceae bacterium]|nr:hypothetical protein [Rhodocyclaceae bacterium]